MKISLALVLVSLSALTVAKPGLVRERKPHGQKCATRKSHTTYPGTYPPANPATTPNPGATPNSDTNSYQATTTLPVTHANPVSYTSSATPAATTPSSGGWVQNPSGNASFTAYDGCQAACESSIHCQGYSKLTRSVTSSPSLRPESEWVLRRGK